MAEEVQHFLDINALINNWTLKALVGGVRPISTSEHVLSDSHQDDIRPDTAFCREQLTSALLGTARSMYSKSLINPRILVNPIPVNLQGSLKLTEIFYLPKSGCE